jgi:hypothetical protein
MNTKPREHADSDRERILCNIAALLASELYSLSLLPAVQEAIQRDPSRNRIQIKSGMFRHEPFRKGALVNCWTSTGRQQHPYLISFVEENGSPNDPQGLVLRAVGRDDTCNYGNESFLEITGIPEKFLWEGNKRKFALKVNKALQKIADYGHRFRYLTFPDDKTAEVWIGEVFGGLGTRTKPYAITLPFDVRLSIKAICEEMKRRGYGTREFEPEAAE